MNGLDPGQLALLAAALVAAGVIAGFAGGLFGIGGGVVIVPVLFHALGALGFGEERMHVAVATSLATIIVTSVQSVRAHAAKGAVDLAVLRAWTPWIVLGAAIGGLAAAYLSGQTLSAVFGVLALAVAANMALGSEQWRLADDLPKGAGQAGVAGGIGFLSALMGIGGGAFGVTVMTLCGRPIHQAVGTAAGFGAAIGVPAVIGYIIGGWGHAGLPPLSLGYVNIPGFIAIGILTSLMAPIGARAAHRLDKRRLKQLFAVFLALTACQMLYEAIIA